MHFRRICLDMDGVLCDFYRGIARLLNQEARYEAYLAGPAVKEASDYEVFGINKEAALRLVDDAGEDFWANLEPYPWFKNLHATAETVGEGCSILSSCGRFSHAHAGKLRWLKRHGLITKDTDVILSHRKYLHAGRYDVLIDDNPEYLRKWEEAGGYPLLVNRHWNGNEGLSETEVMTALTAKFPKTLLQSYTDAARGWH